MIKITRNINFTYNDELVEALNITGKQQIELESKMRDVQASLEEDKGKGFYLFCLELLPQLIVNMPIEVDGESVDWKSMSAEEKTSLFESFPVTDVIGLWTAYSNAINPTEEDKKK